MNKPGIARRLKALEDLIGVNHKRLAIRVVFVEPDGTESGELLVEPDPCVGTWGAPLKPKR